MKQSIIAFILFCSCNTSEKVYAPNFEQIDFTYDSGWKVAYSMKIYKDGSVYIGDGRWNKKYFSATLPIERVKSMDSLFTKIPFSQYDSNYKEEIEDQSSYKVIIIKPDNDTVSVFVYGKNAPLLLENFFHELKNIRETLQLEAKDTTISFLSLRNFYLPPIK
ncbi:MULTISPECIES: hypothetical protein [unclassified Flavihumibacter]|uniref:DUF6438 domain-containing protein n=1 Tax=unclassified Flavihumibacter TaxID=2621068 RepID=UPI00057DF100|nr:hypothetical protein [Flavihumibacter sp. ZG627]KIC89523.1 hypothetical protein HY58_16830 [Flavihumibacter sp. ZG627]